MLFLHWLLSLFVFLSISAAAPPGKKANKKSVKFPVPITWGTLEDRPADDDQPAKLPPIELGAIYWLTPKELGYKDDKINTFRHPVVVIDRVEDPKFLLLGKKQRVETVEVYFVAQMSSKLPMEQKYIGNAGELFERPEYIIESKTHSQCLSDLQINTGMAQAALGSVLSHHAHKDSGKQAPLIMPGGHRMEIKKAMELDFTEKFRNGHINKFNAWKFDLGQEPKIIHQKKIQKSR